MFILLSTGCTFVTNAEWVAAADRDGDGHLATLAGGADCNDADGDVHPAATEVCNGADDDCDGEVDEDVETSWFVDADGDGWGEPDSAAQGCVPPSGAAARGEDCDDADAAVFPGAVERCDGLRSDCSGTWTSDAGRAGFTATDGTYTDLTESLSGGGLLELDAPGTLALCAGAWQGRISASASVEIVGPDGAESTALDAGGEGSVVTIAAEDVDVLLRGLTLTGGLATESSTVGSLWATAGGGLRCATPSAVALDGVVIAGNEAEIGGGILLSDECALTATQVALRDNQASALGGGIASSNASIALSSVTAEDNTGEYGGAIYASSTTLELVDAIASGNVAEISGAGLFLIGGQTDWDGGELAENLARTSGGGFYVSGGTVTISDVTLTRNSSSVAGGGLLIYNAGSVTMERVSLGENLSASGGGLALYGSEVTLSDADLDGNSATGSGGGLYLNGSSAIAMDVTFSDSTPGDVYVADVSAHYDWKADASFTCDPTGCR